MATTQNTYTGNGSTTAYSFTFPYLNTTDIKVTLDAVATTAYTLSNATTIAFTSAPGSGVAIRIFRQTDADALNATFYPGSAIRSSDLNNNFTQNLYVTQESERDVGISDTTANTAKATADTALTNSAAALSTANTADTNASAAVSTANTASTNASAAVSTANSASTAAGNAVTTANAASTAATNAVNTANATAAAQAILEANVYDSTELDGGQLDSRYYTETELNAGQLDNRYYTETEADARFWNVDSNEYISSGNTWSASDSYIATTAAIDARIVDLVDDVGGFVPIANETSFPNTNPDINNDAGTLISVPLANNLTSNSSGVIEINNGTLGNSTVTINGAEASTTYVQGFGILVETTSTLNTYTFHRYVPKATEVTTVANNITQVNTVSANISNVNTVAGISPNVTTVAGIASNVTSVAGNATNINTVSGISSDVTTVAGDTTAINNITSNLSAVQNAATNATNAASSATASAGSATASATSATASAASATTATTQATNAASSATTATTQATNASSSATAAATSATNAATSETNSAASAVTASSAASTAAAGAVSAINALGFFANYGLITATAGTTTDYGALT